MDTINGPRDLFHTYGCSVVIYDLDTGLKKDININKYKLDYIKLWICPNFYTLFTDWKIRQTEGLIKASDLIKKPNKKIFTKFNKEKDFTVLEEGFWWMGVPVGLEYWVDKEIIVHL